MDDLIAQRVQKLESLKNGGINPYGKRFERTGDIKSCVDNYTEGAFAAVAGRIVTYRGHGKTAFCDLMDWKGKIQIYVRKDSLGDKFEVFQCADIGDIIGVRGTLFKTRTGEITVLVNDFEVLCKSLKPLPEKWHGLKDVESRYRQRYLDLLSNKEAREIFAKRSAIVSEIRKFLDGLGFIEVETPMMQSMPGGAAARPFITHHTTLDIDLYLRIAPELYLKRLLVGGMEKIYEINRNFRNEGISRTHNPEFTMLEVYAAYEDYAYMMDLAEKLISNVANLVCGGNIIRTANGAETDFTVPWKRISMHDAIQEHTGVTLKGKPEDSYARTAEELGVQIEKGLPPAKILEEIFAARVEKNLRNPTFVTDYPTALCPLSKARPDNPDYAERFELFINGMEVANAYSELNDPMEQRRRFLEQISMGDEETGKNIDEDFILALEHGMPPAGGLGIGIDRLVMALTGADNVREVILFPQLRPLKTE